MPVTQLQPTATPGKIRVFVAKAEVFIYYNQFAVGPRARRAYAVEKIRRTYLVPKRTNFS